MGVKEWWKKRKKESKEKCSRRVLIPNEKIQTWLKRIFLIIEEWGKRIDRERFLVLIRIRRSWLDPHMFGKKKEKIFFFENNKKESVQLEHENVTELVLVTLRNGIEEGERFSNRTRKRIQWLQKNWTRSHMKWKSHVRFCRVAVRVTYLSTFPLLHPKNQTLPYVKLPEYA